MSQVPQTVAIIGTGLIGRGWAVVFARAGSAVRLWDPADGAADAAHAWCVEAVDSLADAGLPVDITATKTRLAVAASLAEALDGADYAQESAPEKADVKRDLFIEMDRLAPAGCILASSSSAIPGSRFLADLPGRARAIVAHPANPPHLLPAVEVVPSPWHDRGFVRQVSDTLAAVGQWPVLVETEIEGFVMNRLQAAVVNEAMALVGAGVIAPDDLDRVMKGSLGLRWSFLGPFETMDLNAPAGFLDYARKFGSSYATLGRQLTVGAAWKEEALEAIESARRRAVPSDRVAARQAWRDDTLARLRHLLDSRSAS